MKETKGLTAEEKRFLAGLIRQVWRGCQGFVTLVMERGPGEAVYALEELVEWSGAQSKRLRSRSIPGGLSGCAESRTHPTWASKDP